MERLSVHSCFGHINTCEVFVGSFLLVLYENCRPQNKDRFRHCDLQESFVSFKFFTQAQNRWAMCCQILGFYCIKLTHVVLLAGEIVNLINVDCQKLIDAASFLHDLWSAPLQVGGAMFLLYQIIGVSVFVGRYHLQRFTRWQISFNVEEIFWLCSTDDINY